MSKKNKDSLSKNQESIDKSITFTPEEQKQIVDMAIDFIDSDVECLKEWQEEKAKDLQRVMGVSPSKIQNLVKKAWMSDRDIGLCGAVCDSSRSVILAKTANANLLTVTPTEVNDIDRSKYVERFMKWAVSDPKKKFQNVLLGAITNSVNTGIGFLKVGWIRKASYVNKRTVTKEGKIVYKKAEKEIFEDAFIENINDVDDILCPDYGNDINDLDNFIVINHMYVSNLIAFADSGIFINVDEYLKKILKGNINDQGSDSQKGVKDEQNKITESVPENEGSSNVDVYECYFDFEKNGILEKYRFYIEKENKVFLGGKPLRDIVPSGRLPYVAVPYDIIPGRIRSMSLVKKIRDITDQINCIYNQNTDFQYLQNLPVFVGNSNDQNIKSIMEVSPGDIVKTSDPANFNRLTNQASFAWSDSQMNFLLSQLEKRSGMAGQFLTTQTKNSTATRDMIVDENSKVRQGLEISSILSAFSEALNLLLEQYQYFAPASLGTRILGKEGKQLFSDFKPKDIMGRFDIKISEDIVGGNQAYKANLALKRLEIGLKDPFVMKNQNGLWQLYNDTYRDLGIDSPEIYRLKQPLSEDKISEECETEFFRIQQGEKFDPPEGKSKNALTHLPQHIKQRQEQAYLLDKEALEELDRHILLTMKNIQLYQQEQVMEQMSNELVLGMGGDINAGQNIARNASVGQEEIRGDMSQQGSDRVDENAGRDIAANESRGIQSSQM